MYDVLLLCVAAGFFGLLLAARKIETSFLTMPLVCLALGFAVYALAENHSVAMKIPVEIIAEITLAIVLFSDASQLKLTKLKQNANTPFRMLSLGMVFSVLIGTGVIWLVLPNFPIWEMVLLAALLTPTDAALGDAIFSNDKVPQNMRDSLLAESGLNDGLALPFIIFAACAAVGGNHELNQESWLIFATLQIVGGVIIGALVGWLGGMLVHYAISKGWASEEQGAIAALMLVAIAYIVAGMTSGNSFVAVFVAGLLYGKYALICANQTKEFLEQEGMVLTMLSFVFVGGILLPNALGTAGWQEWVIALLALFIVRPAAIYLSLLGTNTAGTTRLFYGWFGPRGLATALFGLFVLEEFDQLKFGDEILAVATLTVVLSAILHGASAHVAGRFVGDSKAEDQSE